MNESFEILPLRPFTQAEVWPIIGGYETDAIYAVEKTETDLHTRFDIRLIHLDTPYRADFYSDFGPDDFAWYQELLQRGYSFGAYQGERLIGLALAEAFPDRQLLRVWEFHVLAVFHRMGIGRALMTQVVAKASQEPLGMIKLETQNTNVRAIRFYRSMGFTLDSIDMTEYFDSSVEASNTAFYMKRRLPASGQKDL